ncbi:MAG: OmpA family protein [Leptospiraceae bacterium]|nr:OmpA family protein [Leptospiraceae bacterium]
MMLRRRLACSLTLVLAALLITRTVDSATESFQIELNYNAISPNRDGVQDFLLLRVVPRIEGLRQPITWDCEILDESGERVYYWRADKRKKRIAAGIGNLFWPSDTDLEPVRLFDQLVWDARKESGHSVTDGNYEIRIRIVENTTSRIHTQSKTFRVDTRSPEIEIQPVKGQLVVPPGQIPQGELELRQKVEGAVDFTARLYHYGGPLIYERHWHNQAPAVARIQWTDLGQSSPEIYGRYRYRLIARDQAGNQSVADYSDLTVTRAAFDRILTANKPGLVPGGADEAGLLEISLRAQDANGLVRKTGPNSDWRIQILNESESEVYLQKTGSGNLPWSFYWDGRDADGEVLSTGLYKVRVFSGGQPGSASLPVRIGPLDADPSIDPPALRFVPDGDGREDTLRWSIHFQPAQVARWQLALYLEANRNDNGAQQKPLRKLYRFWQGQELPQEFIWDGQSDEGQLAQSFEHFFLMLETYDWNGHRELALSPVIETGLVLRPLAPDDARLRARLPEQNYFNATGQLTASGRSVLQKAFNELGQYPLYQVSLESHSAAPGREEQNLERSERKALQMRRFVLENHLIDARRLRTRGFGETELCSEKDGEFEDYRNERIELRLDF